MKLALLLLTLSLPSMAEKRVVFPPGAKPIGPYSPGIIAGDFLYVAGQGARDAAGKMPETFDAQTRQCLDNVKAIVETAGLTMEHVVYTQVYLAAIANFDAMDRVYRTYFPRNPPARVVLGVARMPTDTPVEINAIVVRDLKAKRPVFEGNAAAPAAVVAGDRIFLSGIGSDQVQSALDRAESVLKLAGSDLGRAVFLNVYLDPAITVSAMNRVYRKYFENGYTPARATIPVAALPPGMHVEITGAAVRDLRDRRVVRPKNMAPSPTASPCVFAGDTLFCSAKAGFIPGPDSGIWPEDVGQQVRQTMRNLLDGLEEAGMDFSNVVATNVYLDDISEFAKMNDVYARYFGSTPPARTTVQPLKPAERKRDASGRFPKLEEISLIAVK